MSFWGEPGIWWPANHGSGRRPWFLFRDSQQGGTEYREDSRGYLICYASHETAQRAADRLNAAEVAS